jgi:hypothetical protein
MANVGDCKAGNRRLRELEVTNVKSLAQVARANLSLERGIRKAEHDSQRVTEKAERLIADAKRSSDAAWKEKETALEKNTRKHQRYLIYSSQS